jgi:hypothetical protein
MDCTIDEYWLSVLQNANKEEVPVCTIVCTLRIMSEALSSSLGNQTIAGSDRSDISSASFGIQII